MRLYTVLDFIHCDIKFSLFLVLNAGLQIFNFFKLQLNRLFGFNFQSFSYHNAVLMLWLGLGTKTTR